MAMVLNIIANPEFWHWKPFRIHLVKIKVRGFNDKQLGFGIVFHNVLSFYFVFVYVHRELDCALNRPFA